MNGLRLLERELDEERAKLHCFTGRAYGVQVREVARMEAVVAVVRAEYEAEGQAA